ncbi:hypothetical protein BFR04_07870 [Gaetbulibacter sp. 4G1]|nr:hypothetical protein BFR04_07870 [Gaetbulibacter sp. 4G1]
MKIISIINLASVIIILGFKRLVIGLILSMFFEDIYLGICSPNVFTYINKIEYIFVSKKMIYISIF